MVCLQNTTDRELIEQYLTDRYEVIMTDSDLTDQEFDLCIIDRISFKQKQHELVAYKEAKAPVIVPFLLFVTEKNWSRMIDPIWEVVDDVIPIPTPTPILISRIERMLQTRKYSLELKQKNEQLSIYEQAINATNAGLTITDATKEDNPIIFANEGFQKLTGYSKEEVLGRNCRFLQEDDRGQDALKDVRSFIDSGEEGHATLRNYKKDGTPFWNELSIAPITDASGKVTHFVGIQNDITELIEIQEKLKKEKDRYRLITENVTDMVIRNKPDGTFTYVSPSSEQLTGYKPEELIGRTFYEFFHPDDLKRLEETHEAFMNNPGIHKVSYRFKTKSGEYRWLESSIQAIRDVETGEVTEVQGSVRNITERKEYEQKLEKERNLFKKLTDSSPVGISILNTEGQITFANEQAEKILGLSKDKVTDLSYKDPKWKITDLEGDPFPEEKLPFAQVVKKGQAVYDIEHAIEWPDGRRRILSINAAPLKDENGNLEGVIASLSDVTESKQREKQLKEEQEFVRAIIDNMPGIFYMLDEDLNFVSWNRNMVRELGYSDEEIEDMHALDFVRKEEKEYVINKVGEVLKTGNAEIEVDLIDKQGNAHRQFLIGTRFERNDKTYIIGSAVDISERVEAEYGLQQQKKLLSAIINQTESIIYVKNKNGGIKLVNQQYKKLFDPDYPYSGSKVDLERFKQEAARQIKENDKKVFETGELHEFKEVIPIGDETRHFISIKYPLKDVPGFEDCICGISTDITEREEAYRELKERSKEKACLFSIGNLNEQYDDIEKILKEAVQIIPRGWQYPEIAEAAVEYDGKVYTTDGFEHNRWGIIAESQNFKSKSVAVKVVYLEERPSKHKGPFIKEERELINVIADTLASEIERIESRKKLEESEKRWEQLVQKNPGLVQIIEDDEIVFINPAGAGLYGVDNVDDLIGRSWTEFVQFEEDEVETVRRRISEAKKGKVNPPQIYRAWTADDTERYVELQSVPVQYKGKTVLMTVGQEVTDRVKFERQLKKSLKEKEILLQEIHHRVKNNLAVISGLLQIQRFSSEDERVNKVLSNSEMRIKSMALIHEKLYQADSLSEIDFKYYIKDLLTAIEKTIKTGDELALNLDCDSVKLNVNQAVPCALILNELISNSVEHAFKSRSKGQIFVEFKEKDNVVFAKVRDDGIGLPEDFSKDESRSMGFTIINTLLNQLNAKSEQSNEDGASFSFSFEKGIIKGSSSNLI